jgi:hypothetical protein
VLVGSIKTKLGSATKAVWEYSCAPLFFYVMVSAWRLPGKTSKKIVQAVSKKDIQRKR